MTTVSQLGDARTGKLADNLSGFGRTLRRAGVCVDAARMALAQQAVMLVGLRRDDFCAALEAVLVSREQDRLSQPRCGPETAGTDAAKRRIQG